MSVYWLVPCKQKPPNQYRDMSKISVSNSSAQINDTIYLDIDARYIDPFLAPIFHM